MYNINILQVLQIQYSSNAGSKRRDEAAVKQTEEFKFTTSQKSAASEVKCQDDADFFLFFLMQTAVFTQNSFLTVKLLTRLFT